MKSEGEMIADIVAEMREKATHFEKNSELMVSENAIALFVFPYADRIEAAAKREKAEWESAACACVSDAVMSGKIAVEHAPVGNAAAMREALDTIHDKVNRLDEECGVDPVEIRDLARAALADPARNCDFYDNKTDAETRFVEETGENDTSQHYWQMFAIWLFAPATERKGENK